MTPLTTRLAEAGGGSRELDGLIFEWATGLSATRQTSGYGAGVTVTKTISGIPAYTTSLDAIVALIGERLPENGGIDLYIRTGTSTVRINQHDDYDESWSASGKTIELAACRALLRALKDQGHE